MTIKFHCNAAYAALADRLLRDSIADIVIQPLTNSICKSRLQSIKLLLTTILHISDWRNWIKNGSLSYGKQLRNVSPSNIVTLSTGIKHVVLTVILRLIHDRILRSHVQFSCRNLFNQNIQNQYLTTVTKHKVIKYIIEFFRKQSMTGSILIFEFISMFSNLINTLIYAKNGIYPTLADRICDIRWSRHDLNDIKWWRSYNPIIQIYWWGIIGYLRRFIQKASLEFQTLNLEYRTINKIDID